MAEAQQDSPSMQRPLPSTPQAQQHKQREEMMACVASLEAALLPCLPARELQAVDRSAHSSHQSQSGELCISPGGRFPPFSSEGKPPRKVAKGPRDLALCRVFRQSTCCDIAQTYPALVSYRKLASSGEASQGCLHLWELLECSICHPQVGVQPGPPLICASFCDMILLDCSSAYFSIDPKSQVLSPCGLSDIVCGRASEWASNGTELCRLAGFAVQQHVVSDPDADQRYCYGGKASLESISGSWRVSRSGLSVEDQSEGALEDFRQWFGKMPVNEKAGWAIGGMMLVAGLLFVSKRKSYRQRQKQVAVLRAARRIEARVSHHSTSTRRVDAKPMSSW